MNINKGSVKGRNAFCAVFLYDRKIVIVICRRSVYNKDRKEWVRQVGVYLNSKKPFGLFFDEAVSTYFIDKSEMLKELIPLVANSEDILEQGKTNKGKENKYITQTSHIKNGLRTLKNQYFNPQNSNHAALCPYFNASCIYFGSL